MLFSITDTGAEDGKSSGERAAMSRQQAYTIEINGQSAGIVVAQSGGFMFFAADRVFHRLDRQVFPRVAHAERAVHQLVHGRLQRIDRANASIA